MDFQSSISIEILRQLLVYQPETGKLFWLYRPLSTFPTTRACNIWNARFAGKEAFTALSEGYKVGRIHKKMYKAHRVIWALYYGNWPNDYIDHIDHNRDNNRIENLRITSHSENCKNRSKVFSSGNVTGIYFLPKLNSWRARIRHNGKTIHLGYFKNKCDAAHAYENAKIQYNFHQNHGR